VAKRVAFDNDLRLKSVNLDGDVYNPSGTLQGGYRSDNENLVLKISTFRQLQREVKNFEQQTDSQKA